MSSPDAPVLHRRLKESAAELAWNKLKRGDEPIPLDVASTDYSVAGTGGAPVTDARLAELRRNLSAAVEGIDPAVDSRLFDQVLTVALQENLHLTRAEAGRGDIWDYLTFVVVPDLAVRRFPVETAARDRFRGDSRRHVLRRLYRRGVVFEHRFITGSRGLSEDEFVQLLERQTTGLRPRLANAIASHVVESGLAGADRREFLRRTMKLVTYRSGIYWLDDADDDAVRRFVATCASEAHPEDRRARRDSVSLS